MDPLAKLSLSLLFATLVGCTTETAQTKPQRSQAEIDAARAVRREADAQRRATNQLLHAQEDLRRRYEKYTTAELHLMHRRYADLTRKTTSLDTGLAPAASSIWGSTDKRHTDELIRLERELMRRWKAGDATAKLPEFQ